MRNQFVALCLSLILVGSWEARAEDGKNNDGKGFAFYEDTETQAKSPKKDIASLLQAILDEQRKQTKLQEQILAKLDYIADEPKMVEINGKKCLANSTPDCFVMPVTGDGKRIPAMRKWIEEPTMANAINYYNWQAKYLNHVFNAGYAYHFSSLSVPNQFQGYPNYMVNSGGYKEARQLKYQIRRQLQAKAKNMKIMILLGENLGYDIENNQTIFNVYDEFSKLGIDVVYVFKSKKSLEDFNRLVKAVPAKRYQERWSAISDKQKVVSPNTFVGTQEIKIHITPMYILKYDSIKEKKHFSQVIGAGKDRADDLFEAIPRSLMYWNVYQPADFSLSESDKGQINESLEMLKETHGNKEEVKEFKKILEEELKKEKK